MKHLLIFLTYLAVSLYLLVAGQELKNIYFYDQVGNAVVRLHDSKDQGWGTGYHLKMPSGTVYIVTNAHICEFAEKGVVYAVDSQNDNKDVPRKVIKSFKSFDLCLVQPLDNYPSLQMANDHSFFTGKEVKYIGYPRVHMQHLGEGKLKGVRKVLLQGIKIKTREEYEKLLESANFELLIDAMTVPGASGSPLVDKWGRVIGTIRAMDTQTLWGYAVPVTDMYRLFKNY